MVDSEESQADGLEELIALSSALVERESENPPGNERACAEYIVEWFQKRGIEAELLPDPYENRPQAVATIGSGDPTIVLNGHIDVVPVDDASQWTYDPYEPTVADDKLYGRGSTDMKTPLACAMLAAASLGEEIQSGDFDGTIIVQAAVGEETGDPGTKRLLELGYDGDYGVVVEPTSMRTATSQKGVAWYELTLKGEAGHASRPEKAVNPLDEVDAVLQAVRDYDERVSERTDDLLGRSMVTITSVDADTKENVIPDQVRIKLDRRFLPSESLTQIDEELRQTTNHLPMNSDLSLTVSRRQSCESSAIPVGSRLADVFRKHTWEVAGVSREPWGDDAASDVRNFINDAQMEAITWGPSETDLAHIVDEYIELEEANLSISILKRSVRELLQSEG